MATVEFVGQTTRDQEAPNAATSRLLNLYREAVPYGELTRYVIKPVPGQTEIASVGSNFIRAIEWVDGTIYLSAGGRLQSITPSGVLADLGEIVDSSETSISGNSGYITVCASGRYFVLDGGVLTEPAAGAFSDFGSVATVGNYTVLTERNGRRLQWSNVADPHTLDGLDFATAKANGGNIVRGMELNDNWWVFKERSAEVWYQTGVADDAFRRVGGGTMNVGLKAFNLVTETRDALFFVGNDGLVYLTNGQGMQPVSTRAVEQAVNINDATHCFYYEHEGHKFCIIRFSDRPAWVFDIVMNEWHERSLGQYHDPWDAVASAQIGTDDWLVGAEVGQISQLGGTQDNGGPLWRRAVSRTLRLDGPDFRVAELELYGAYGYRGVYSPVQYFLGLLGGYIGFSDGNVVDMGSSGATEPYLHLSYSNNGGATWTRPRPFEMGGIGEYNQRILGRSLGQFTTFTVQVDMTHTYNIPVFSDARVRLA